MVLETLELCDLHASDSVGPPALLSGVQALLSKHTGYGLVSHGTFSQGEVATCGGHVRLCTFTLCLLARTADMAKGPA